MQTTETSPTRVIRRRRLAIPLGGGPPVEPEPRPLPDPVPNPPGTESPNPDPAPPKARNLFRREVAR